MSPLRAALARQRAAIHGTDPALFRDIASDARRRAEEEAEAVHQAQADEAFAAWGDAMLASSRTETSR